jgi:predicted Zn finger-like uncharacterized protein
MKIQCPACNASYRLPDDRIQGKNRIFKISCKKCGAEIRVRGVETVDDMGRTTMPFALELPAAAPVPLSQQQVWFAGIDGKQLGPMTEGEVGDHIREGRLGPSDLVWKKGFSQWMPVREVSPFDDLVTDAVPATPDAAKPAEKRSPRRAQTLELSAAMIELLVKLDGQSEQGDAAGNAIVVPPELPPLGESVELPLKFGMDRGSAIVGAEDESNVADTTISAMPMTVATVDELPPAVPNAEAGKTGKPDPSAKSGAGSIKVRLPEATAEPERRSAPLPTGAATTKQADRPASIVVKPVISLPTTPSRPSIQPVEPARPATAPTRPSSGAQDKSTTPTVNAAKPATGAASLTKTTPPPVVQAKQASAAPAKPNTIVPTPAKQVEQRPSTGKALETKTPIGRPTDPARPADLGRSGRPVPKKKGNTGLVVAAAVAVVVVLVVVGALALQGPPAVPEKVEPVAVVPAPQLAAVVVSPPAPPPVAEVVAATAGVVGADAGAGVQAAAIAVPEPAVAVVGAGPDATDTPPDVAAAVVAVVEPAKVAPVAADKPKAEKAEKVEKAEKTEKAVKPEKAEAKAAEKPKMSDDDVERLLQKQRDKDKAKADQEAAAAAKAAKKGNDDAERLLQKQRDKEKAKADQEAAAAAKAAKKADEAERLLQKQRDKEKAKADQEAAAAAKTSAKKSSGDDDEIDRILAKHDKKSAKEEGGGEEASGLSQSLVNTIAAKVNKKVLTCVMLGDVEGETALKVSVTVNSDGSVMNAAVQGKFAKTPVAHCVSDAVKTLVFPQSSGPAKKYTLKYAVGS